MEESGREVAPVEESLVQPRYVEESGRGVVDEGGRGVVNERGRGVVDEVEESGREVAVEGSTVHTAIPGKWKRVGRAWLWTKVL